MNIKELLQEIKEKGQKGLPPQEWLEKAGLVEKDGQANVKKTPKAKFR